MEYRVIGDAKVSSHQVDEDLRVSHGVRSGYGAWAERGSVGDPDG